MNYLDWTAAAIKTGREREWDADEIVSSAVRAIGDPSIGMPGSEDMNAINDYLSGAGSKVSPREAARYVYARLSDTTFFDDEGNVQYQPDGADRLEEDDNE